MENFLRSEKGIAKSPLFMRGFGVLHAAKLLSTGLWITVEMFLAALGKGTRPKKMFHVEHG